MRADHDAFPSTSPTGPTPVDAPVGSGPYVVRQGECIASIAFRLGVDPASIWDLPGNQAVKDRRRDGSMLLPGDRLALPEASARPSFAVSPGDDRTFRARVPRMTTQVLLLLGDEPRANKPCTVVVDGKARELTTDGDGKLTIPVLPSTRFARVTIHDRVEEIAFDEVLELDLGGLNPVSESSGVQARLRNLGYNVGAIDGAFGARTRTALEDFQRASGLTVTGEPDEATRSKLVERHGL